MKWPSLTVIGLIVGVLVSVVSASAHHGSAAYDNKNPLTLNATITKFVWANPHAQIYFDVKDDKGKIVHWGCETANPALLSRNEGWSKEALKAGDQVMLTLRPARNGTPVGILVKIVFPDGRQLEVHL